MKTVRPLFCKEHHRLGEVRLFEDEIPQIMIYRQAVKAGEALPLGSEMIGPITGEINVTCSICQNSRILEVSIEVTLYFIENMPFSMRKEFWGRLMNRAKALTEARDVTVDG
jgi:hypothetical protein